MKTGHHQNEDGFGCFEGLDVIKMKTSLSTIPRNLKFNLPTLHSRMVRFWQGEEVYTYIPVTGDIMEDSANGA